MAPIGSLVVATIALAVAAIAHREKLNEYLGKHWKLFAVVLGTGGVCALYLYGWPDWTRAWLKWFLHRVEVPVWILILGGLVLAAAPVGILLFLLWAYSQKVSGETGSPRQLTPSHYTSDEIFGVEWTWTYRGNVINHPEAFCPRSACNCRLDLVDDFNRASVGLGLGPIPVTLVCPHCSFRHNVDWDENELLRRVSIEIERRIRAGEFQDRLAARLNSNQT